MYSKLKILGHPIHPMLVAFPIALYVAAFLGFVVYAWLGDAFWFRLAFIANIAGVIMALVAALFGFGDWLLGIPRHSSTSRTGVIHLLLNVSALVLFAINAIMIWNEWNAPTPNMMWAIPLTLVGSLITVAAGYFGYELIQRHHVGVILSPEQERLEPITSEETHGGTAYRQAHP